MKPREITKQEEKHSTETKRQCNDATHHQVAELPPSIAPQSVSKQKDVQSGLEDLTKHG